MFLNKLLEENNSFVDFAIKEHKNGNIDPDSYVISVNDIISNANEMLKEAKKYNLKLYYMTKQIGRNPYIAKKLEELGYDGCVVVDFKEAMVMIDNGIKIGNVGHLVQIPKNMLKKIVLHKPEVITVFSIEIAKNINQICEECNLKQDVILKVIDLDNDQIYDAQEGGFEIYSLDEQVKHLKEYKNINIVGVTSFPAMLYKDDSNEIEPTNNLKTINKSIEILKDNNIVVTHVNMPSSTSTSVLKKLCELGGTDGEPGHSLTGTFPAKLKKEEVEKISYLYVSEISHNLKNYSYCYGGGFYPRGHLTNALIIDEERHITKVIPPNSESIDYYFKLHDNFEYGSTVIMCFRTQMFVTRSTIVLVDIVDNKYEIIKKYTSLGVLYE